MNRVNFRDGFGHDDSTVDIVIHISIIKLSLKTIITLRLDHLKENKGGRVPIGADFCFSLLGRTRVRPLPSRLGVWRSVVSSASGVRGRAPAADEFSKFWSLQNASAETYTNNNYF